MCDKNNMKKGLAITCILIVGLFLIINSASAWEIKSGEIEVNCAETDDGSSFTIRNPLMRLLFREDLEAMAGWALYLKVVVNSGTVEIAGEPVDTPCTLIIRLFSGYCSTIDYDEETQENIKIPLTVTGVGLIISIRDN
jgi:hypothetical protein